MRRALDRSHWESLHCRAYARQGDDEIAVVDNGATISCARARPGPGGEVLVEWIATRLAVDAFVNEVRFGEARVLFFGGSGGPGVPLPEARRKWAEPWAS